jgi:hypothetical protein
VILEALQKILDGASITTQVIELLEREMSLFPTEKQVNTLKRHQELQISDDELKALVKSGKYKRHIGLMPGEHYRRKKGKGSYHLRVKGNKAYVHWDKWDPRRHPVRHALEVPRLWKPLLKSAGAGAATGALVGGLVAKYKGAKRKEVLKKAGKWAAIGGISSLGGTLAYGGKEYVRRSRKLRNLQTRDKKMQR